jgi:hypothetical protein
MALPVVLAAVAVPLGELSSDGRTGIECMDERSYDDKRTWAQASWN